MYELVGPYLVHWSATGEQRCAAGQWTGHWAIYHAHQCNFDRSVARGSTDICPYPGEALSLAKNEALKVVESLPEDE